jgi:hypothetical protein
MPSITAQDAVEVEVDVLRPLARIHGAKGHDPHAGRDARVVDQHVDGPERRLDGLHAGADR